MLTRFELFVIARNILDAAGHLGLDAGEIARSTVAAMVQIRDDLKL